MLSSATEVNIYRLNRRGNDTSFQLIDAETIKNLSSSPLLSSQPVLESIFHRGVVVCEGDSDRLYYQSIATRAHDEHEVQFLHAHNKQTLKDVISLLRAASIPCAAIADIDLLNSDADLRALLESFGHSPPPNECMDERNTVATEVEGRSDEDILAGVSESIQELQHQLENGEHTVSGARSALRRIDSSSMKWNAIKRNGVDSLEEPTRSHANDLISRLADLGIFVVPVGELESWVDVGTRRKKEWIVLALTSLASDGAPNEVSEFIGRVIAHARGN